MFLLTKENVILSGPNNISFLSKQNENSDFPSSGHILQHFRPLGINKIVPHSELTVFLSVSCLSVSPPMTLSCLLGCYYKGTWLDFWTIENKIGLLRSYPGLVHQFWTLRVSSVRKSVWSYSSFHNIEGMFSYCCSGFVGISIVQWIQLLVLKVSSLDGHWSINEMPPNVNVPVERTIIYPLWHN